MSNFIPEESSEINWALKKKFGLEKKEIEFSLPNPTVKVGFRLINGHEYGEEFQPF